MGKYTSAVKGTQDVLPQESYKWQYIERILLENGRNYGFKEIRVPVFEHTELFDRSVGDTTDVVQKEMYTFDDKGGRSITLRPEGTAGTVRSVIEHGLFNEALPLKCSYILSCYRYEKPQAGRLREFHQFGAECFGPAGYAADAEVIAMAASGFDRLGVDGVTLEINSIGCPECRKTYLAALREYFEGRKEELCDTCRGRLERNPMRILDCKSPVCSEIASHAPKVLDYICDDCREHFEGLKMRLDDMGIEYVVNPKIVRGLDYYTRTVFEFVSNNIGAQGTVCAGGRYDGLVSQMGGPKLPALGFAMGLERLLLLMQSKGVEFPEDARPVLYIAPMGENAAAFASRAVKNLREEGFYALYDVSGRGLKAQMKYADKIRAEYCMVVGDDEMNTGKAVLKNMDSGEEKSVSLEGLTEEIYDMTIDKAMGNLTDSIEKSFGGKADV